MRYNTGFLCIGLLFLWKYQSASPIWLKRPRPSPMKIYTFYDIRSFIVFFSFYNLNPSMEFQEVEWDESSRRIYVSRSIALFHPMIVISSPFWIQNWCSKIPLNSFFSYFARSCIRMLKETASLWVDLHLLDAKVPLAILENKRFPFHDLYVAID